MVKKSSSSPERKVSDSASTIMARAQDASDRILLNSYLLIGADIIHYSAKYVRISEGNTLDTLYTDS
ncbi:hypothetical protein ASPFODRAFT_216010 [Aspergillus luchuensis CBS 106.47]|uniref:Uncharacterized protein n=1 Tax=Aspergillus luchuensis (strain CBS 106.47) TaxID=1137211 RepID=A0A1M3TRW9_ASPLC|nr:hypothetical protein ASPFODRAFT_216010 [Aspergillus luchuensis CBS 106.47]